MEYRSKLFGNAPTACLLGLLMASGCSANSPAAPSMPGTDAAASGLAVLTDSPRALELTFEKTGGGQAGPVLAWTGTVEKSGESWGALTTTTDASTWRARGQSGSIFHVLFDFEITRNGSRMVLELEGLLNLNAGLVNMNGFVREATGGFAELAGARVHEQGRLVSVVNGTTTWSGVIRIMPGSAN
jgi:hypothetical protein